jgi:hypothetical protein
MNTGVPGGGNEYNFQAATLGKKVATPFGEYYMFM